MSPPERAGAEPNPTGAHLSDKAALSRLCGEPIARTETRRLAVELDPSRRFALDNEAPEYSFAIGASGQIYDLEMEEEPGAPGKPHAERRAKGAKKVSEASEQAQRAALCLGHKLPKKQEEEEV